MSIYVKKTMVVLPQLRRRHSMNLTNTNERPTVKMSRDEIRIALEIDAACKIRDDSLKNEIHERQTVQMRAVKV